jgi:membrane protein YdbS with pleckstrin-like domain
VFNVRKAKDPREKAMGATFTWAVAAAAVTAVLAVAAVVVIFWNRLGPSEISVAGWLAMIFGVIITLAIGIGLMTLMYISNRRGYDEGGRRDC